MQSKFKQLRLALICGFAAMTAVANAQEGNCFGTASITISGPNTRPSLPATISVGVILVEFTDRLHYTDPVNRPNGYLKSDFEDMLFSDNFYVSPPKFNPENENVYGSVKDRLSALQL